MGFMTEISVLNDRWDEIRKEPKEFVQEIYEASCTGRPMLHIIGQTTVEPTHHADDIRVYFSGRNSFFDAYPKKRHENSRVKTTLNVHQGNEGLSQDRGGCHERCDSKRRGKWLRQAS